MRFDPAKGFELDLFGSPMLAPDFIEQTETLVAPRTGWAPPRKRPRRVYKRLAARAFRAHYRGPVNFDARQERLTKHTAPGLADWLRRGAKDDPPVLVTFAPVMVVGKDLRPVPSHLHGADQIAIEEEPDLSPFDADEVPRVPERTLLIGRAARAVFWHGARRFEGRILVYAAGSWPPDLQIFLDWHMGRMKIAVAIAGGRGLEHRLVIAKQTSYRP